VNRPLVLSQQISGGAIVQPGLDLGATLSTESSLPPSVVYLRITPRPSLQAVRTASGTFGQPKSRVSLNILPSDAIWITA
jgi:hypothetical protein